MPIYEYKCKKCGSEFEVFQKISETDAKNCKFCRGPVSKLMSLSSFQLQGSGWYVTDYGGKKPNLKDDKPGGSEGKKDTVAADTTKLSGADSTGTPAAPAASELPPTTKDNKVKAA